MAAVFSALDFSIIKKALLVYLQSDKCSEEEKQQISKLYHRLGRIDNE